VEEAHRLFHESLVSACRFDVDREFCEQLFHAFERYTFICPRSGAGSPLHSNADSGNQQALSGNAQ